MAHKTTNPAQPAASDAGQGWQGGWYRGAQHRPSPNHGPRPVQAQVDLLVLHSISLPPGDYSQAGAQAVAALFANQLDWNAHPYYQGIRGLEVSAHFLIARSGQLVQFVDCDARAWHAGASHYRGRSSCNDDSIGIELQGLEGDLFAPAQYQSLMRLCRALVQRYPIRYVAGHEHIAPGRKRDPGPGFDWSQLDTLLCGSGVLLPPGIPKHPIAHAQP